MSKKQVVSAIKQSEQLELELADVLRTVSEPAAALAARAALDAATMVLQSLGKLPGPVPEQPNAPVISAEKVATIAQQVDLAYGLARRLQSSVHRHEGLIGRLVEADEQHQAMAAELAALQATVAQLTPQDAPGIRTLRTNTQQETQCNEYNRAAA